MTWVVASTGVVYAMGINIYGLGIGATNGNNVGTPTAVLLPSDSPAVAVRAHQYRVAFLLADGRMYYVAPWTTNLGTASGNPYQFVVGSGETIFDISTGQSHFCALASKAGSNNKVYTAGENVSSSISQLNFGHSIEQFIVADSYSSFPDIFH
jgi:hypothetical protein